MHTAVPVWVEQLTMGEVIGLVAGLALAGTIVGKMWRWFSRAKDVLDDLAGEPARPGVPARPGLMERMQSIEDENAELSVIHSTVNRTETKVNTLADKLDVHITHSTADRDALWKAYRDNHPEEDHDA